MKKAVSVFMILAMCVSCLTGCKGEKQQDPELTKSGDGTVLTISFLEAGYGRDYMEEWAKQFTEKKKAEGVDIEIVLKGEPTYGLIAATLPGGPKVNDIDIYFAGLVNEKDIVATGDKYISGYDVALEDLSDIYQMASDVEGKTIGDKMLTQYVDYFTLADGKQYAMPWASDPCGIVVNTKVLDEALGAGQWVLPRTTAELGKMASDVTKSGKAKGIIYAGQVGYWDYALSAWWAQYEGVEEYNKFFTGQAYDEEFGKDVYTYEIFNQKGILKSLTVLEQLIGSAENLVEGCNSTYFTTLQTNFLQGAAAFMPNGGWFENEMRDFDSIETVMMKMPVISEIIEKTPSISNDSMLAEVVDFVDGKKSEAPAGVTKEDIQIVKNARNIIWDAGFDFGAVIPAYADARNLAKEFLAYTTTDEAIEIFYKNTGSFLPYEYDYNGGGMYDAATAFGKSKIDLMNAEITKITQNKTNPLFAKNSLTPFLGDKPELILGAVNPKDKKTAEQFFTDNYMEAKKEWNNYMTVAGLSY